MSELKTHLLPTAPEFEGWLELEKGGKIEDLLQEFLLAPLEEFLSRPGKRFRGRLVELAYELLGRRTENRKFCEEASLILEAIHAASLVIDDIQDGSEQRRGKPSLHREHGLAVALNAGNWLYFWPFEKIRQWNLPLQMEKSLVDSCHRALLKAHAGQALDVGTSIDKAPRERIEKICLGSLELKTGALVALAFELGGILNGATPQELKLLSRFGLEFGVALQMLYDVGNLKKKDPPDPKRFEDLRLRRPSWIWACAATELSANQFERFKTGVSRLPHEEELEEVLLASELPRIAKKKAISYLDNVLDSHRLLLNPGSPVWKEIEVEVEKLKGAYG